MYLAPFHTKFIPCVLCGQFLYTCNDINDDANKIQSKHMSHTHIPTTYNIN